MAILSLLPDTSSYSYKEDANEYFSTNFDSAAGAYSKGFKGVRSFTCQWTLNAEEYIEWLAFFRSRETDMDTFQIDLVSEDGYPAPHVAKFVYTTFTLSSQSGDVFVVACNLLAKPGEKLDDYASMATEEDYDMVTEDDNLMILERL